jgi:ATP phosphoribosyltransferase regulatory subunit
VSGKTGDSSGAEDGRAVRLPRGVRDYLPEAAARRRGISGAVLDEVERWGYRRIITPAFEYESVLSRGLGAEGRARAVRFVEPGTGEVVMLRPDITPQVARLAATRLLDARGPLRLAYEGAVVRLSSAGQRELFQAGVELIDAESPDGDAEVIALAAAALAALGVVDFVLDLGEARLPQAALAGIAAPAAAALREAIARKDVDDVARKVHGLPLPAARRKLLAALPGLYGGPEVIERAARLLDGPTLAGARAGLRQLEALCARLAAFPLGGHISIDLGEVRGFDYYTGVRFSGYAPGVGEALLSGGRYDGLVGRYGRAAAAAGFAVDVERVALALEPEQTSAPRGVYVAGRAERRHAVARGLRRAGVRAVEELDDRTVAVDALRARAARAGAAVVMVLERGGGARWFSALGPGHGRITAAEISAARGGGGNLDAVLDPPPPARYPASAPSNPAGRTRRKPLPARSPLRRG